MPGGVGDAARPSRRQQRGDLKSITAVAGSVMDAGQVLMEISDGALVRYVSEYHQPKVEPIVIPGLDAMPPQEGFSRKLCLARVGNVGIFIGGVASYNSNTGRGQISLRPLNEGVLNSELPLAKGFWGFAPSLRSDPKKTLQKAKAAASSSEEGKQNHTGTTITVKQQPTKKVNAAPTCDSPLHEPDISNWTNPPASAIAERVSKEVATPSHEQPMNIQLFATASTSKKDIVDPIGKKKKRIKTMDLNTAATPQDRVGKTVSVIPQTLLQPKKQVVNSTPGPTITTNAPQERSSSVQPSKQYRRPSLSSSEKSDKAPSNLSATTPKSTDTQSIAVPVPATPQLRTAEQHLAAARAKSQTFVAAISSGAQVSPESRPGTSTKVASKKKNEIDIRVYLATASMKNAKESHPKEKRDAPIAAKPAQSALKEMPQPSFPSPPVPRKRATTEEEIRDIATTLCDMGSAGKPVKAAAKRPYSEIGTSTPSTPEEVEDVTPRRKVAKRPPLSSAYKKNHVVASDRFFQECNLQQQRLETILENQIPKKSVNERMGISSDLTARTGDLAKDQEMARMRMAAQHRASHEQLLKRVINAAAAAVRAMKRCTTIQGVVDAKETWQKSFQEYVEMLDDIVWRQTQDAETLAQQQTLEGKGRRAPQLQVGFPFYTSFDNCIEAVETIINVVKNN